MSLWIKVEKIDGVLLADGWHDIKVGSFYCDAFELMEDSYSSQPKHESTGFGAISVDGVKFYAPLSSILAVRTNEKK